MTSSSNGVDWRFSHILAIFSGFSQYFGKQVSKSPNGISRAAYTKFPRFPNRRALAAPNCCPYATAVQVVSSRPEEKVVAILLNLGADPNIRGGEYGTALQAAVANGRVDIMNALLAKGTDVNAQGGEYGTLQAASAKGETQIVELLLEKGADVNAQGGKYGTVLYAASRDGKTQIVKLLLEKGTNVNAQGMDFAKFAT
ncbi:ankyrin repeat-containing domain protein [Mycena leptocephala]|nr:ankyrin repeat-containing domain protein [Mycena leptocephala]